MSMIVCVCVYVCFFLVAGLLADWLACWLVFLLAGSMSVCLSEGCSITARKLIEIS